MTPVKRLAAFTLIEIVLAMGIMSLLLSIGLPIVLNMSRRATVDTERETLVTLLVAARDQAMANVAESDHGVAITTNQMVEYQGATYATRDTTKDNPYPRTQSITISGATDINFDSLSGRTTATSLTLSDGQQQRTITINEEGAIDW